LGVITNGVSESQGKLQLRLGASQLFVSPMPLPPATPNTKSATLDEAQLSVNLTPHYVRASQSGTRILRLYDEYPLDNRREWLRLATTCYVIHAPRFLETFLPELEDEGVVDRANDVLMSNENILKQEG
jgi:hypothetical protein